MEKNTSVGRARKSGQYLKYAIGEILLVVIGILIALQINNWNQLRKKAIAEKEFITGVKNDLRQDRQYIELIINHMEPRIEAYNFLDKEVTSLSEKDQNALDSIFQVYFVSQRTFYPISGSFQSAISGNEINTYKNKEATYAIIKLYNSTYDRLIDNGNILDERWDYLSRKYSYERRTGHIREMNNLQLSELMDDIYHHFAQLRWYQNMLNNATVEIDELLEIGR